MHLTPLDFLVLSLYLGGLIALGAHFSRRQKTREEYMLGGRNVHWLLAGGSVLASLLSTLTYIAIPGEVIRYGLIYPVAALSLPLLLPIVNGLMIPRIRSWPVASIFEYLERRYTGGLRTGMALLFLFKTLLWLSLILYSASFAIAAITQWPIVWLIVGMGLATTVYTSEGGLKTVVWTDNLQLLVLLGGAVAVPFVVWRETGTHPGQWLQAVQAVGNADIRIFSWDPTVRLTLVGMALGAIAWNMCAHSSDQVAVQRYLSTPDVTTARRSVHIAVWGNVAANLLLGFCGVALFAFYQIASGLDPRGFHAATADRADRLLPQFLVEHLPAGISGLVLAALLAAAMSSLSSGINSISGVLVRDFFERFGWGGDTSLRLDKGLSIAAGLVATAMALAVAAMLGQVSWNLIEVAQRLNNMLVSPIAVPVFAAALFPRSGWRPAVAGAAVAAVAAFCIVFSKELLGMDQAISFMWVVPVPLVVGLAVAGAVTGLAKRSPRKSAVLR